MIVRQDSSASFRQGSELGDEWDLMQLTHTSAPYVEPLNHELVFCQERHKIMEGSGDGSPQSSMCMVKAAELFPKPILEKEEEKLTVRFTELAGESIRYLGQTDDGILALSNYRLFLQKNSTAAEVSVPLGLIESTQVRELFHLIVNCKDASTVRCSFATSEQCGEWHRRISLSIGVPETLEALFAFPFHAWASESPTLNQDNEWAGRLQRVGSFEDEFRREAERLQFDLQGAWRISQANAEFKLCPSYPRLLLVPACISDDTLQNVASFRSSRRIPAVVWRHQRTGAVIARCSQPEVGWLGWRNSKDEQLLKALSDACSFDRGTQDRASDGTRRTRTQTDSSEASSDGSPPRSPEGSHEEVEMDEPKKILIVDARSYTSAVTNRARGGGCECAEYYPSAEIQFMSLGNIHVIRKSFHALRQLCASQADIPNWLGLLERTLWLQHLSGLLAASMVVCHAIERSGRPVLVHCSDGWDRTPQIVATAQLCLDPYYRTIEGFRVLVEREWLSFGHKFADRCGHGPGSDETNERCPVFLQWLDCVHQIHRQFPCSFEFDMGYLIKLAQHSHSCLFGTFLCNTVKERQENSVPDRTFSVWPFLSGPIYKNHLYVPNRERVLWPAHNVRDLRLWTEVYLGSWGGHNQQSASESVDYPAASVSAVGPNVASAVVAVGIRSVGTGVEKPTGSIVVGGSASVNGVGGIGVKSSAASASATSPEQNGSMTKTRSYSDIKEATSGGIMTRRSSDPSMIVDSSVLGRKSESVGLNLSQEESSLDSNISSDRETSPDLPSIDGHLLDREAIASSFIQQATEKLQSLTQELNQSDEELEQTIRNQRMLADSSPLCGVASAVGGDSEDTFRSAHKPSSASSSLFPNGLTGGVDSLAVAAAATLILTATTNVRPSFTTTSIGEESIGRYRFQPIVPELPTVVPPAPAASLNHSHYTSTMAPVINVNQLHGKQQHQLVTWPDAIDENTSRIIKIESYQPTNSAGKDIPDGGGGDEGFGEGLDLGRGINRAVVGRPIMTNDDMMMESVDLTIRGTDDSSFGGDTLLTDSPNQLESPLPTARSLSPNLWHGSIETSTDTLVPMDQYPPSLGTSVLGSQQECLQNLPQVGLSCGQSNLSDAASTETPRRTNRKGSGEATIDDVGSISLAVVNSDSSQLGLVNGKGSVTAPRDVSRNTGLASDHYATKTQTGDSNGCDFTSNSQDYHRNLSNQPTLTLISDSQLPKDRTDSRYHHQHPPESMLETDRGGCRSGLAIQHAQSNISSNASCNKLKANGTSLSSGCTAVSANANPLLSSMMLMDESIIIQPQFQHLEINGKHPVSGSAPCEAVATSTIVPLKERRRRNSSNSKHDLMSPCKPTNGSISPSATHSRFSTPGARSLPLTPPSAPFAADRPPVATFSCPDGLAHALSEQNLRLQQIVYEHRLREEALQRELYATRLALLKKFCQHCCSSSAQQQYGNEDPVPVSLSITSVATFTATAYAMARDSRIDDRRKPPRSSHGSRSSSGSTSTITTASLGTTATATPVCQCDPHGVWDPAEMFSPSLLPPEESTKPALLRAPPVEHHPLLIFSDEEDDCPISSRCDGAGPESDQEQEERLLCQEMLKHESRLAHNAVVCRTIRRFLERTRHKRMTCPMVAAPAVELSKSCALPALLLEESVNEHYAYGGGSDSDCNCSGDKSDGDEKYVAREWTMRRLARARGGGHHREGRRELNIDSSSSSEDEGDGGGGGGGEGGDSDEEENGDVDDAELSSQLMVDSMNENASNCSWEAVDDRSAPSSGANSSQQMQYSSSGVGGSNSVLWVPDHAVTRCTTCQTEFWLGRRKHHCRSCGQIFCAECSEFTAHLPDERLYQPVRLCGPCYQRISTATSTSGASVPSTSTHGNIAQQHVNAAPSMLAANGSTSTTNEDSSAFLYRSNATATATAIMRDRITSMSQMQTLLAAECSSEAPRASESCCKQNVTAAATN